MQVHTVDNARENYRVFGYTSKQDTAVFDMVLAHARAHGEAAIEQDLNPNDGTEPLWLALMAAMPAGVEERATEAALQLYAGKWGAVHDLW
jgi:hypothetical protein